jgi:hypothetical protein
MEMNRRCHETSQEAVFRRPTYCSPFRTKRVFANNSRSLGTDAQRAVPISIHGVRAIGPIEMADSFRLSRLGPILTIGPGPLNLRLRTGSGRTGKDAAIITKLSRSLHACRPPDRKTALFQKI